MTVIRSMLLCAVLALATLLMPVGLATPASAQISGNLPPGSWQQSCRNGYAIGSTLVANCPDANGRYRLSSLSTRDCAAFGNNNGKLFCEQRGSWNGAQVLPGGSWQSSCRDGRVSGSTFYASCPNSSGRYRTTSADIRQCNAFGNNNGRLFCETAASVLPGGSWQSSCRNGRLSGSTLYAQCQDSRGRYQSTSASTRSCNSFGNNNGRLFCETSGSGNWPLPGGSWRSSCRDDRMSGYTLSAQCQDSRGRYRSTSADVRNCNSFGNNDGRLFCEANGGGSGGNVPTWTGSFRSSCTGVMIDVSGLLTARCDVPGGGSRVSRLTPRECPPLRAGNRGGTLFCEF